MGKWDILNDSPLFAGIQEGERKPLLDCLNAVTRTYEKNDFVFAEGEKVTSVGLMISGGAHVIQEDFWGNRTILTHIGPGELFGESFSCAEVERLPVSVVCTGRSEILLIDYKRILNICPTGCGFHAAMIANMMRILAQKNIFLTQKMENITKRTTREKLLAYLSAQARAARRDTFEIPFNRQELADYLAVERSAMSAELSRMSTDGLLKYKKNHFTLLVRED